MKLLKYILGVSLLITPILAKAQVPVDFSQNIGKYINQNNGVAGLDADGNVTNSLSVKNQNIFSNGDLQFFTILPSNTIGKNTNYWTSMKPNSVLIGGTSPEDPTVNDYNSDGQLNIIGMGDGNAGQGCLLCVIDTKSSITKTMPGLNTAWPNGVAGIASYGVADSNAFYDGVENRLPDMVLDVSSYTSTEVVLKTPLTSSQIERIHQGMYILTNSIDTSMAVPIFSSASNLPSVNYYASIVQEVEDSTHIKVSGWAVPGSGNSASGQIPSVSNLDTNWTNYGKAVVGIGAVSAVGNANWRIDLSQSARPNSFVHRAGFIELDFGSDYPEGTYDAQLMNFEVGGNAPSADSFVLRMDAMNFPTIMNLGVGPNAWGIKSSSFMFHGNAGVSSTQSDFLMAENDAFSDATNNIRLASYLHKRSDGPTGVWGTELYFGASADGTQGNSPYTDTKAQNMGAIGFNVGGSLGGISLCSSPSGENILQCNFKLLPSGDSQQTGNMTVSENVTANAFVVKSASTGETNVLIESTGNITATGTGKFSTLLIPQGTPASSTDTCVAGQIEMDADYIYSCVATNTWHRTSNGGAW